MTTNPRRLGKYELRECLGRGGMGEVWKAFDTQLQRYVAIKFLLADLQHDPSFVTRFQREAQAIALLHHPNIVQLFDFQVSQPPESETATAYMVMEYIEGQTLADYIRTTSGKGSFPSAAEIVSLLTPISLAIDHAHQKGIIHRDIKPANILLDKRNTARNHMGKPILTDFGLAKLLSSSTRTLSNWWFGTPHYTSPEQARGAAGSERSDLYALGVILYELCTGVRPFQGENPVAVLMQHITSMPPSPALINPTLPPALTMVLVYALAKDPAARFPSASSMTIAVAQALDRPIPEELSQCAEGMMTNGSTFLSPTHPLQSMDLPPSLQPAHALPAISGQAFSPAGNIPVVAPNVSAAQHPPSTPSLPSPTKQGAPDFVIPPSMVGENLQERLGHLKQPMTERNVLISASAGPTGILPQQGKGYRVRHALMAGVLISLVIVLLLGGLSFTTRFLSPSTPTTTTLQLGIGVTKAPNGEYIGISDGTFAFDTQGPGRTDGSLKQQAAAKLKAGDVGSAVTLWQSAVAQDTNDVESLIYQEDQHVLASGYPHITLVVGTVLSGAYVGIGRTDLQGAYVAQKEYNDGFKLVGGTQVRLLIANTGTDRQYVKPVAQQIVQAAQTDKTIVGVMGWPASKQALNAVTILAAAHIPLVSQDASSVLLTGISPYFFRIVPPDTSQATAGAKFIEQSLHARTAALFVDPTDAYSNSLADAFKQQFIADGNSIVVTEQYTTVSKPEALPNLLQDALSHNPDFIYFAGYAPDASAILTDLPTSGPFAKLMVVGGDGLYEDQGYSQEARAKLGRLRFTAFAFPDEWGFQALDAQKPPFFREYPQLFDPGSRPHPSPYGYSRPNSETMQAFDATIALLEGCRIALAGGNKNLAPHDLRQALATITGPRTIQGVTGQIAFGPDDNPIDKAVIVLSVTQDGFIQIQSVQGRFLKGP